MIGEKFSYIVPLVGTSESFFLLAKGSTVQIAAVQIQQILEGSFFLMHKRHGHHDNCFPELLIP